MATTPVPKPPKLNSLVKRNLLKALDDWDEQIVATVTALAARLNGQVPAAKTKVEVLKDTVDTWITNQLEQADALAEDLLMTKVPAATAKLVEQARAAIKAA